MARRALLVLVAVAVASAPAAGQIGDFGYQAGSSVDDERYQLQSGGPQHVLLVDDNGNERIDDGEAVFLSTQTSTVSTAAVRLASPDTGQLGSQVESGDSNQGSSALQVTGDITYLDIDGDNRFSRDEPIFFEDDGLDTSQVDSGDLVLRGEGAGSVVASGDWRVSQSTSSLSTAFRFFDADDDGSYSLGDRVYLDLYTDGWASVPDVRITADRYSFGSMLKPGQDEVTHRFGSGSPADNFIYVDGNGNSRLDTDERVFLAPSSSEVTGDSIRIANPASNGSGSYVGQNPAGDLGDAATQLSGNLAFNDQGSDGELDPGETLYYDRSDGTSGEADSLDIILSGSDAGQFVRDVSGHSGLDLDNAPGTIEYIDADGDDRFSFGDPVYLDADSDQFVSSGDVQLGNYIDRSGDDRKDTDGDGVDDADDNCPDTANGDQADADGDGTGDACDDDIDGDGVANDDDNCPDTENADQADSDGDGTGDECDDTPQGDGTEQDTDGDSIPDDRDNCPANANPDQTDSDRDGTGDACDPSPQPPTDSDGDGVNDAEDNCPRKENADQTDTDGDGAGDECDGDIDDDGLTNVRERGLGTDPAKADTDGDGVRDDRDNCPTTENADQADSDDDGTGDACPKGQEKAPGPGVAALLLVALSAAVLGRSRNRP